MNTASHEGGTMLNLDTANRAARMLEAGRVTVTFRSPTGTHITILAKARGTNDAGKWVATPLAEAKVIFFEVPNEQGFNDKVGKYTRSRGFVADASADTARAYCAKQLLAYVTGQRTTPGLEIHEEDRCGKCGRQLTDPVSIKRGIGPECYGARTGSAHETKQRTTAPADEPARRVPGTDVMATASGATRPMNAEELADLGKAEMHDDLAAAAAQAEIERDHRAVVEHEAAQERHGDGKDKRIEARDIGLG